MEGYKDMSNGSTPVFNSVADAQKYFSKASPGIVTGKIKKEPKKQSESNLQQACVKWFRLQYPAHSQLLFAIPNGGTRIKYTSKTNGKQFSPEAVRMRAEGVIAGVSDLFLAVPYGTCHGMFIEMKYGENTLTSNQKEFLQAVKDKGFQTAICYSIDEFMLAINKYFS